MPNLTDAEKERLKELAKKARHGKREIEYYSVRVEEFPVFESYSENDLQFLFECTPEAVKALLEEVEELKAERGDICSECGDGLIRVHIYTGTTEHRPNSSLPTPRREQAKVEVRPYPSAKMAGQLCYITVGDTVYREDGATWRGTPSEANAKADSLRAAQSCAHRNCEGMHAMVCKDCKTVIGKLETVPAAHSKQSEPEPKRLEQAAKKILDGITHRRTGGISKYSYAFQGVTYADIEELELALAASPSPQVSNVKKARQ